MNYKDVLLYGVYTDLRTEIARRLLGFLWWIIEPVIYMLVFYIVFGLALRQGGADYVPFLLCGMIAWKWFDGSVRQSSIAITSNAGLIQQIHFPKSLLALTQILTNTFKFTIILLLLIAFLVIIGKRPSIEWLGLFPLVATQLLLIIGIGFLLAALIPFAQDLKIIIDNMLMLMMFMSGIFFSAESVPPSMQGFFELNPMVLIIEAYRDILLRNHWPDWSSLAYCLMLSLPAIAIGLFIMKTCERRYAKILY